MGRGAVAIATTTKVTTRVLLPVTKATMERGDIATVIGDVGSEARSLRGKRWTTRGGIGKDTSIAITTIISVTALTRKTSRSSSHPSRRRITRSCKKTIAQIKAC